jgi:CDP-diacylglycerol--serine O-phosphatidyltransferase
MMLSFIPALLTLLNMVCGFLSIMLVANGRVFSGVVVLLPAFVFDLLDGWVARMFGWTSDFGVELDSLADTVSFVIAPAFIVYWVFLEKTLLGMIVAFLIASFGILRLAKFNLAKDPGYFVGMSTPYFTTIVIGVYLTFTVAGVKILNIGAQGLIWVLLASLMISKVRFPSLKSKELATLKIIGGAILFICGVAVLAGAPVSMVGYGLQVSTVLFLFLPLSFKKVIRRKGYWVLFVVGVIAASVWADLSGVPETMVGAPLLAAVLLSPLVQLSMEQ